MHKGFQAQILAYMLDSLVRVSRRVNENHFIRISNAHASHSSFLVTQSEDRTTLLCMLSNHVRVRERITIVVRITIVPQSRIHDSTTALNIPSELPQTELPLP